MAILATFVRGVVQAGRLVLREPLPSRADAQSVELLSEAYRWYSLGVAGPAIPFHAPTALAAACVLYQAAWSLLNAHEVLDPQCLRIPSEPVTGAQHASADLMLRYLPAVHRRARALRPTDELHRQLADLLQRWPLSGVLADIEDGPRTPLDFDGHRGLQMLYAERLARHQRPAWFPTGPGFEAVELIWHDLGRDPAMLPLAQRVAAGLADNKG
jgi:hypothetical protein